MDFSKDFFQKVWGEGYYENFSYGVGIEKVCEVCLNPFFDITKHALEIGSGGGVFTERMIGKFEFLTAIDVIKEPEKFHLYQGFNYFELPDQDFKVTFVDKGIIDFCFSYNTFCHLSNEALTEYLKNIYTVLKPGGDFVFMLSNYNKGNKEQGYRLGELLPMGHFYQDERTLPLIADFDQWQVVSENMIPEHRDIIVHLKKI